MYLYTRMKEEAYGQDSIFYEMCGNIIGSFIRIYQMLDNQ